MRYAIDQYIQTAVLRFDMVEHGGDFYGLRNIGGEKITADFQRDLLGVF